MFRFCFPVFYIIKVIFKTVVKATIDFIALLWVPLLIQWDLLPTLVFLYFVAALSVSLPISELFIDEYHPVVRG